jgi:glycerophosphoryl diester phosphodiesterase
MKQPDGPAVIVAHRGLSALYPENTLLALEQAVKAGAMAVEFDVQLTSDLVPVLLHDPTLERMTGLPGRITECTWRGLSRLDASYPGRFAQRHAGTRFTTLQEAAAYLRPQPGILPCIEIKTESLEYHGLKRCVKRIIQAADPLIERSLLLSFSQPVIELLQGMGFRRTGLVLPDYSDQMRSAVESLQPSVLIADISILPADPGELWRGPWDWMAYQTEAPETVKRLIRLGMRYIETDNVRLIAAALPGLFVAA